MILMLCTKCYVLFPLAGFPYDNSLRMHMLLHDKERPYTCDQCGKSFVAKSALRAHEELHTVSCVPYLNRKYQQCADTGKK